MSDPAHLDGIEPGPDAVFAALADGTRRALLAELAAHPASATELAAARPISRQAVVKHLAALSDAGLVARERAGREVRYRFTPEPLSQAAGWMADVGAQWDRRLGRLAASLAGRPGAQRGEIPR